MIFFLFCTMLPPPIINGRSLTTMGQLSKFSALTPFPPCNEPPFPLGFSETAIVKTIPCQVRHNPNPNLCPYSNIFHKLRLPA